MMPKSHKSQRNPKQCHHLRKACLNRTFSKKSININESTIQNEDINNSIIEHIEITNTIDFTSSSKQFMK